MNLRRFVLTAFLVLSLSVLSVGTADALFPSELMFGDPLNMLVLGTSIVGLVAGLLFYRALLTSGQEGGYARGSVRAIVPVATVVGLIVLFSSGLIGQLSNLVLVISVGYTVLLVIVILGDRQRLLPEGIRETGETSADAADAALDEK